MAKISRIKKLRLAKIAVRGTRSFAKDADMFIAALPNLISFINELAEKCRVASECKFTTGMLDERVEEQNVKLP